MSTSRLWQKVTASAINCSLVVVLTAPLLPVLGVELWKIATISSFFIYNMIFRTRCIGMRLVGTYIEPPTSPFYALLYTLGFASFFYSAIFPLDLLLVNGVIQTVSVMMTGNTAHGNFAGQGTMTRDQYVERCKGRARLSMMVGDPKKAVHELIDDLGRYKDTSPPSYIADLGLVLLKEADEYWISHWIEGIR